MTTEQRLARLERENRWMKRVATMAVALVAACVLTGQGKDKEPQDLVVRSLTVVDKDGKRRAELFTNPAGSPFLTLKTRDGQIRAMISATAGGSAVGLYDPDGKTRAYLETTTYGSPSLTLYDGKGSLGKRRVQLSGGASGFEPAFDGSPALKFYDAKGDVIWQAPR